MKKKILLFSMTFPPMVIGTANYAMALAEGLHDRDFDVVVLAPGAPSVSEYDSDFPFGIKRVYYPSFVPLKYIVARKALKEMVVSLNPDCVWATNGMAARVAGLVRFWDKTPLICTMHGSDVTVRLQSRIESIPQARAYRQASAVGSVSEYILRRAHESNVYPAKTFIHSPRVDSSNFTIHRYDQERFYSSYPQLRGKTIVLSVARLVTQKRIHHSLSAFSSLASEFPDIYYLIVGDGNQRLQLEDQARRFGCVDRVIFTGAQDPSSESLLDCYSAAKIFFLPSVREGMGAVFCEAGGMGLPVLAVKDGGVPEIVKDGVTGLLAQRDDVEDMTCKLRLLLNNEQESKRMGAAGRKRVEQLFSREVFNQRATNILQQILGNC
ncbi:MAG: glycosyltransferase family 4 protein [Candidatus Latescibacterota bacterium]|nr:glycosyltransferase family 4 protein [Candidatus Latescibacterota bacterium]